VHNIQNMNNDSQILKCVCKVHPQRKLEVRTFNDFKICIDCIEKFLKKLRLLDDTFKIKFD